MAAAGKSSSSLHIEEYDSTLLILGRMFYLVFFNCMNYHLTMKYKTENLLLNKLFSNFKLQKNWRIFLYCLKERILTNDKIFSIVFFSNFCSSSCSHYVGLFYAKLLRLLIKAVQSAGQKWDCKPVYFRHGVGFIHAYRLHLQP